ncbi:4Fe-4S dicluster domain-containing protein [Azospirillum argentinense]|uniref:Ferredoxin family protein n=1 Tax=Azospirillum brasilense TaxID=192 RepID=A0A4D8Q6F7_AZOBR|nr:ferredoxin family protein [Azospirillum argentinense]QCO03119.1 ferredoxin family protein [Azospirillum argentinense]
MIALISESRCAACGTCVRVCPTGVFDERPGDLPVIARQNDCQSCFLCEIHCPTDALYVDPDADRPATVDEAALAASGALGSYARALGWNRGRMGGTAEDLTLHLRAASAVQAQSLKPGNNAA